MQCQRAWEMRQVWLLVRTRNTSEMHHCCFFDKYLERRHAWVSFQMLLLLLSGAGLAIWTQPTQLLVKVRALHAWKFSLRVLRCVIEWGVLDMKGTHSSRESLKCVLHAWNLAERTRLTFQDAQEAFAKSSCFMDDDGSRIAAFSRCVVLSVKRALCKWADVLFWWGQEWYLSSTLYQIESTASVRTWPANKRASISPDFYFSLLSDQ
jgi:hypothetical protein